jgi:hypothetical protein
MSLLNKPSIACLCRSLETGYSISSLKSVHFPAKGDLVSEASHLLVLGNSPKYTADSNGLRDTNVAPKDTIVSWVDVACYQAFITCSGFNLFQTNYGHVLCTLYDRRNWFYLSDGFRCSVFSNKPLFTEQQLVSFPKWRIQGQSYMRNCVLLMYFLYSVQSCLSRCQVKINLFRFVIKYYAVSRTGCWRYGSTHSWSLCCMVVNG